MEEIIMGIKNKLIFFIYGLLFFLNSCGTNNSNQQFTEKKMRANLTEQNELAMNIFIKDIENNKKFLGDVWTKEYAIIDLSYYG
jgi:hypothetical protein